MLRLDGVSVRTFVFMCDSIFLKSFPIRVDVIELSPIDIFSILISTGLRGSTVKL